MIRIDNDSIKSLAKLNANTRFAVIKLPNGCLFHSNWFAFLVPPDKISIQSFGEAYPDAAKWDEFVLPSGSEFFKGIPSETFADGEQLIQFITDKPGLSAFMRKPVFDWINTHCEDPEFFIRASNQAIAVKENGILVGGVGWLSTKPAEQHPPDAVVGT